MKTLVLDCDNICHIARHAFGTDLSHGEEQTGILWGFLNTLLRLAKQFNTNKFLFAWDSRKSFRKLNYPPYKANRRSDPLTKGQQESENCIRAQFNLLRSELLPSMGFCNVHHRTGWEADDIIALLVKRLRNLGRQVVVVSTDKDMYQLLDDCDIYRPLAGKHKEIITKDSFRREYGINSDQWLAVKAWAGDSGDNVEGVRGVGIKTAIRFLKGELPVTSKIYKTLSHLDSQVIWERNMELLKIPYPELLPVRFEDDNLGWGIREDGPFSLDVFLKICDRYGFESFLKPEVLQEWRTRFGME